MEEHRLQRQLSLVPYASDSREVVLRHGNTIVVYDPQSRELLLRMQPQTSPNLAECPLCHRQLQNDASPFEEHRASPHDEEQAFVSPEYFRMLAHSTPEDVSDPARPLSPRKQLPALAFPNSAPSTNGPPSPVAAESGQNTPAHQTADNGIQDSSFLPNYFSRFFIEKRELGRGGRGVVLLVEHVLDGVPLGEFACKRIPVGNDHLWLEKVLVEAQLLQRLNHQNLVSYRHLWLEDMQITKFGPAVPCVFILQQYCNAGDLHGYVVSATQSATMAQDPKERLRRRSKAQTEPPIDLKPPRGMHFDEIFSFFRDITSGLHHLHMHGLIHRDLKPSNCLLNKEGQKLTVHVSDFGETQAATAERSSTGATGTISYCAPEVLLRETPGGNFGNFSTKSDIFSLGMIVYFMCFGRLPYNNADIIHDESEDLDQLRSEVSAWTGFDDSIRSRGDLPERLYKFLKRLLSPNPLERPSTEKSIAAIKGGGGIDDFDMTAGSSTSSTGNVSPRISSVDSPAPKSGPRRTMSIGHVRPSISQVGRPPSAGLARSLSPELADNTHDSSLLPPDSSIIMRRRKVGSPESTMHGRALPEGPRLILPPPDTYQHKVATLARHPAASLIFKSAAFCAKLFVLQYPCSPYSANAWVLYPLSVVALGDILFSVDLVGSMVLLLVHLLVIGVTTSWSQLCQIQPLVWDHV